MKILEPNFDRMVWKGGSTPPLIFETEPGGSLKVYVCADAYPSYEKWTEQAQFAREYIKNRYPDRAIILGHDFVMTERRYGLDLFDIWGDVGLKNERDFNIRFVIADVDRVLLQSGKHKEKVEVFPSPSFTVERDEDTLSRMDNERNFRALMNQETALDRFRKDCFNLLSEDKKR